MADKATIGNVEVTAVIDMVPPPREPSAMFPGVPADAWAAYEDTLEDGQLQLYYGVFLLKTSEHVILVDTGMGPGPHPDRGNLTGNLYEELRPHLESNVGVNNTNVGPSDSVNYIIHTHLHGDHVGWNLRYSGGMPAPNFRRARYVMSRPDYDYFTSDEGRQMYPYIDRQVMPLRRLRLQQILEEPEHAISDEISIAPAPGHTPGHQVVLINSDGQRGVVMGDVLHTIAQVSEPTWCAGVDTDKEQSSASRARLLDAAEEGDWTICAGHFPPGKQIGKIARVDGKRVWQPL